MKDKEIIGQIDLKDGFSELDIQFARLMLRLSECDTPELFLTAALVSRYQGEGHICFDLSPVAGRPVENCKEKPVMYPKLEEWIEVLEKAPVVGGPGDYRPLILDGTRLYLYRYWAYEKKLVDILKARTGEADFPVDVPKLREGLDRLFPGNGGRETDWQKVAAYTSVLKKFSVISGGPGTGKTYTVAKILALLLEQAEPERLRIALATPTGKAAARLQEAIKNAKEGLNCPPEIKAAIPEEASTIHRLLKFIPDSPYFRHDAQNPLSADVVVIDEASMVALALISKLVQAVSPKARLILLGDKDQLASVEAGAVLGDICDTGNVHGFSRQFREAYQRVTGEEIWEGPVGEEGLGIQDFNTQTRIGPGGPILPTPSSAGSPDPEKGYIHTIQLKKSYRFGAASGIGAVSRYVNEGNGAQALALMKEGTYGDIGWRGLPRPDAIPLALKDRIIQGFSGYLKTTDPGEIFLLFNRFRILCALREGPYGVRAINLLVEQILRKEGFIGPEVQWYPGRPILITKNDYNLRLFNGDVGIALADPQAGNELRVFFPAVETPYRKFPPLRLPAHETVYAMTVHKSQGSEFESILLLLPDKDVPILTRELIYTGVTRAKEMVEVWGRDDIFQMAVSRRIERTSGLRDALWTPNSKT